MSLLVNRAAVVWLLPPDWTSNFIRIGLPWTSSQDTESILMLIAWPSSPAFMTVLDLLSFAGTLLRVVSIRELYAYPILLPCMYKPIQDSSACTSPGTVTKA